MSTSSPAPSDTNVVVVRGTIVGEPTSRTLASGATVLQFDLATTVEIDGRTSRASVPLSWTDPPSSAFDLVRPDRRTVVVGTVRRRFFRTGGATQSRTEVVVRRLVLERRAKSVQAAISAVVEELIA